MKLKYYEDRYVVKCTFEERYEPKRNGFIWDRELKMWCTVDPKRAKRLIEFSIDNETKEKILNDINTLEEREKASRSLSSDISVPSPKGLSYYPFQKAGIDFINKHDSVLLADEMGIGKTIQAIGHINCNQDYEKILIICPASLKLMWRSELKRWLVKIYTVGVAFGNRQLPNTDIVIINYDIIKKKREDIRKITWDVVILDECHAIKNLKSQRTREIIGHGNLKPLEAKKKILLTGTPILNRPIELYSIIKYLDKDNWPDYFKYALRYCGAYKDKWGWVFNGATNLDELQQRLRTSIMIRRTKKGVLSELPDKIRQIIEVGDNKKFKSSKREKEIISNINNLYKEGVKNLKLSQVINFEEIAEIRHQTALDKVPYVIEHLKDVLDTGSKVVCFAHHRDVIETIRKAFEDVSVVITGSTKIKDRQDAVERFQNGESVKLFIGNIQAAGTGLTLTASSHVIFAELDWVPGNMSQAEDRCHRIGQENSVLIQHLVINGSIDAMIAKALVRKQEIVDKALDGSGEADFCDIFFN